MHLMEAAQERNFKKCDIVTVFEGAVSSRVSPKGDIFKRLFIAANFADTWTPSTRSNLKGNLVLEKMSRED